MNQQCLDVDGGYDRRGQLDGRAEREVERTDQTAHNDHNLRQCIACITVRRRLVDWE